MRPSSVGPMLAVPSDQESFNGSESLPCQTAPTEMTFFTTKERLEIGDVPMTIARSKPTRAEALAYYRAAAVFHRLDVRTHVRVTGLDRAGGRFTVRTRDRFSAAGEVAARRVVLATGYFDHPNRLGVEGEELPHVTHYYRDAHVAAPGEPVVVVGGGNSAAAAALDLFRHGAAVTLVVRRPGLDDGVKYWVRPDLENRIAAGEVEARFRSVVRRIRPERVEVEDADGRRSEVAARHVFLLVGYHPDVELLRACGVDVDRETLAPAHDPETLETNVPGLHLAGSVACGLATGQVFIENGREDARRVVPALARSLREA